MSWYSKGFDAAEEQIAATQNNFTRDFFLKDGDEVTIRFLDDEPINLRDHFVKGKGFFTCIQGMGDENCPLCEAGNKASNHFVFNVFDPREYTDKAGNHHKDEVKLWRVGVTLLRLLKKKSSKYGPLTKLDVEVSKMGSGSGSSWDIEISPSDKKFKLPEGAEPYNLIEVLAPKTRDELVRILNGGNSAPTKPVESNDDDDDEDIDWRKA